MYEYQYGINIKFTSQKLSLCGEVIKPFSDYYGIEWLTYEELLYKEKGEICLKSREELRFPYTWLQYYQIQDLYKKDKKNYGLRLDKTDFEKILLDEGNKSISKIYKNLLNGTLRMKE